MSRPNLEVVFRFPSELDLLFTYLERQEEVLKEQGKEMMPYAVELGETEVVVNFTMTDEDWENPLGLSDGD